MLIPKRGGEGVVGVVRVRVGPHCSGVRPKGCSHNFTILRNKTSMALYELRSLVFFFAK